MLETVHGTVRGLQKSQITPFNTITIIIEYDGDTGWYDGHAIYDSQ